MASGRSALRAARRAALAINGAAASRAAGAGGTSLAPALGAAGPSAAGHASAPAHEGARSADSALSGVACLWRPQGSLSDAGALALSHRGAKQQPSRAFSAAAALPAHEEIAMPSLSPTMTHGNIAKWVKAVGDPVSAGDVLCEIETDKATLSMESMEDGFLAKILLPEGSKDIPVGTPIGVMVDSAEDVGSFADYTPGAASEAAPAAPSTSPTPAAAPPSDLPPYQPIGMPSLSPTMTQGNIAKWRKAEGDSVASGDVLCEIETDKATMEMESMEEGFVAKILHGDGAKDVPVGTPIAIMVEDESYIPKFKDFTGDAVGGPAPAGATPADVAAPGSPPQDLPKYQEIGMPSLSPTMTQGNIAKWSKKVGDSVASGDVLCEIETDKATMEMESMEEGFVAKILHDEGSKDVKVGTPIVILVEDAADIPKFADFVPGVAPAASAPAPAAAAAAPPPPPPASKPAAPGPAAAAPARAPTPSGGKTLASPAARKLAEDNKVDLSSVAGTGPGGRIIKADVEDYLKAPRPAAAAPAPSAPGPKAPLAPAIPPSELRKFIAARMVESVQTIPHYYLSVDARVDNVQTALKALNAVQEKSKGSPITMEHIIIKAAAMAAKKVPACNSSWAGDIIHQYDRVHVTLAVETEYGVVNPVLKDADTKGLAEIAAEFERLKEAALSGALSAEDSQGGTFSVASVAEFGLKSCSSLIIPPQACIVTVGASQMRVVPGLTGKDFGRESYVAATLSCDHRVVDGALGAEWLGAFKSFVEDPVSLLL